MKEVSDLTACVVDFGLFFPVAEKLAEKLKRVIYHKPDAIEGFPTINKCLVGDGFEQVEACDDFWKLKKEIDLFVFPDIQNSGLQLELEAQGFPVWGSRAADSIETDREKFIKLLKQVGLEVPPHRVIVGLTNLRLFLMENEGPFFIKISKYRGSLETKKFRDFDQDEGLLDQWAVKFGPAKEKVRFIVCDPIDTDLEIGGDTFCIDGQFPDTMLHGDEWKDAGYLATVTKREDMPKQVQQVLEAFGPILAAERYRNALSMELRVLDDKFVYIDPCHRFSLPATASRLLLIDNFAEMVWHGANGELLEPEWSAQFAAEAVLTMKGDKGSWAVSEVPKEVKPWAKFSNCCEIDGRVCWPPDDGNFVVGWLGATGDTIKEAIDQLHALSDLLPDGMEADTDALVGLLQEIQSGEEQGIEFADKVPEPETALNI